MSEPGAGSDLAVAEHPGRARRRPLRDQRPEGVDLGRQLRRLLLPVLPHRPRRPEAQGHQHPARRHGHARASRSARCPRSSTPSTPTSTRCSSTTCACRPTNLVGELNNGWAMANGSLAHERGMVWVERGDGPRGGARAAARRRTVARSTRLTADRAGRGRRPDRAAGHRHHGRPVPRLPRVRQAGPGRHRARAGADEGVRQRGPPAGGAGGRRDPGGRRRSRSARSGSTATSPSTSRRAPGSSSTSTPSPTRSRPAPRRSSATSSPSACSASPGADRDRIASPATRQCRGSPRGCDDARTTRARAACTDDARAAGRWARGRWPGVRRDDAWPGELVASRGTGVVLAAAAARRRAARERARVRVPARRRRPDRLRRRRHQPHPPRRRAGPRHPPHRLPRSCSPTARRHRCSTASTSGRRGRASSTSPRGSAAVDAAPAAPRCRTDAPRRPTRCTCCIFTSGSTGAPKAVQMSQGGPPARPPAAAVAFTRDDVLYCVDAAVPRQRAAGQPVPGAWCRGHRWCCGQRFSASAFLPDVRRHGCTYFNYVGRALSYILAQPETPDDADNHAEVVPRLGGVAARPPGVPAPLRLLRGGGLQLERGRRGDPAVRRHAARGASAAPTRASTSP